MLGWFRQEAIKCQRMQKEVQRMKFSENNEAQGNNDGKELEQKQEPTPTAPLWPVRLPPYNLVKSPNATGQCPLTETKEEECEGQVQGEFTVTWRPKSVKNTK